MFYNNNNPDYYNDAIRDAQVNTQNKEKTEDSKGKLLLISNLILISTLLGYFIYQDMQKEPKTEVMGVNYTVDIHEEDNQKVIIPPVTEKIFSKEEKTSNIENLVNNSIKNNSDYIQALDNELTQTDSKKVETPHQNRDLEKILADIDAQEFTQTDNVVKIENEPQTTEELDINELANLVNNLMTEEE